MTTVFELKTHILPPVFAQASAHMLGLRTVLYGTSCVQGLTGASHGVYTGLVIEGALGQQWRACPGASFVPYGTSEADRSPGPKP
jgi:hypothetical protein